MKVGKIIVKGQEVGIGHLPSILEEAHRSGLDGIALKQELIRLAAIYNYIPFEVRDDYGDGLLVALQSYRRHLPSTHS